MSPRCLPDASQMLPRSFPDRCFQKRNCLGSRAGVIYFDFDLELQEHILRTIKKTKYPSASEVGSWD